MERLRSGWQSRDGEKWLWSEYILKVGPTEYPKKLRNRVIKNASFQGFKSRPLVQWWCWDQDGEAVREQMEGGGRAMSRTPDGLTEPLWAWEKAPHSGLMQLESEEEAGFRPLALLHLRTAIGRGIDQLRFGTCLQWGAYWAGGYESGVQGDRPQVYKVLSCEHSWRVYLYIYVALYIRYAFFTFSLSMSLCRLEVIHVYVFCFSVFGHPAQYLVPEHLTNVVE